MSVVFIGLIAVALIFIVIIQVARTAELLSVIKGEGVISEDTNRINALLLFVFMILFLVGTVWSSVAYSDQFLPAPASEHGHLIDNMFNVTLLFTGIVFIVTHILLFYFVLKYRGRDGEVAYYFPHNNKLEVVWTVVPAIVLTILVAMGIENWNKITGPEPEDSRLVEITAHQFAWTARYPGADGELGPREFELMSAENGLGIDWEDERSHDDLITSEIFLEVNKPVLFRLGAKDVLHSFYLPHFRVKMDCVPGTPTRFWMTPITTTAEMRQQLDNPEFNYVLACAELCGSAHWNMQMNVVVGTAEEYKEWLKEQTPVYSTLQPSEDEKVKETAEQEEVVSEDENLISAL